MALVGGKEYHTDAFLLRLQVLVELAESVLVHVHRVKQLAEDAGEEDVENAKYPVRLSRCHARNDPVRSQHELLARLHVFVLVFLLLALRHQTVNLLLHVRVLQHLTIRRDLPQNHVDATRNDQVADERSDPAERTVVEDPR